jgi:hypothetical protein
VKFCDVSDGTWYEKSYGVRILEEKRDALREPSMSTMASFEFYHVVPLSYVCSFNTQKRKDKPLGRNGEESSGVV